ncbi:retrovirus-related pol polyprotein LINE-1 [Tanacetum coccineum]
MNEGLVKSPIYKTKGNAQSEKGLSEKQQFGCFYSQKVPRRGDNKRDSEAILEMEKYRERQRDLHMNFLDLEKPMTVSPWKLIWRTLIDNGTPRRYLRVIKDMYEGRRLAYGPQWGSAISRYLFPLILDELSRGIQENIPWCMVFADDIVFVVESVEGLNNKLESCREALEENGLRDMKELLLSEDMTSDRNAWRDRIRIDG